MRIFLTALWLMVMPLSAGAQDLASLVADRVRVEGNARLVAEGDVEILFRDTRLTAPRIVYDREIDRIDITGPIVIHDGGSTLVLADAASLDADLRNGVLLSARLVLDRQLQLAATQVARLDGRYTELLDSVASSCEICAANPTPSWEIRARRIVHDQEERLLYFQDATFRLFGVPIAYFPRLRLPDPTRDRVTGLLIPRVRSTSQLGTGLKFPVFVTLGDHADITLTPYLSSSTSTLEGVYRQSLRFGDVIVEGAASNDDLVTDDLRWYLFAEGVFDLPRGFRLEFDVEEVSDRTYLIDYDYSEQDRLATEIEIVRARRDEFVSASLANFETLRDSEIPIRDQLPSLYGQFELEHRVPVGRGEMRIRLDAAILDREADADQIGRDVTRIGFSAEYGRGFVLPSGLVGRHTIGFDADSYEVDNDTRFEGTSGRITPSISTELRWPLARSGPGGTRQLLEPVIRVGWADSSGDPVPNEDSVLVEFDEGNLFSLSRFPGDDRIEEGLRANIGLGYTVIASSGWSSNLTVGRILRPDDATEFPRGTGLDAPRSDWLTAVQIDLGERLDVTSRALFDDGFSLSKSEARIAYADSSLSLESGYLWLEEEPRDNRPFDTHEVSLDGALRLSRHWTGTFGTRYDFNQDRSARAALGLEYRSECLIVDLSLSRRFTSTDTLEPTTSVGFGLRLAGIGDTRSDESYRKTCNG
ncbi:LPS-assembly protein [Palleronia aestuarii]|uniref:LPS-assembly protein LptD n=1 Tax=Palleronia aestuarii TaxID=568105 RepID=A0A2W7NW27_9RHOB|nr:LPS assembly protein LptD [Palleronia aestuarii]PZX17506.1 LPS-assembly protein [Palleronia aestuarii]